MEVKFNEQKMIDILVDENRNIAIFTGELIDSIGEYKKIMYYICTELKAPYTESELADAIKIAMTEENKQPFFCYDQKKNKTYEEVYYGIKGFNKAMKGKRMVDVGYNNRWGKYASLNMPDKRGYSYTGVNLLYLDDNADWEDYAKGVIKLIDFDPKKDKFVYKERQE